MKTVVELASMMNKYFHNLSAFKDGHGNLNEPTKKVFIHHAISMPYSYSNNNPNARFTLLNEVKRGR